MTVGARVAGADRVLAGWAALVAVLLLAPPQLLPAAVLDRGGRFPLDQAGHFLLFLVVAYLAARAARARTRHPLLWAAAASFLYGAVLEAIQGLLGYRDAEVGDLVANGLGSLAGVLLPVLWRRP
ncbi:MAG TPA: VanZ family protein [Thermoanaerobaculia bacterium]|nr:VanZ family protein [Thermoanaerobaculia bacterium]